MSSPTYPASASILPFPGPIQPALDEGTEDALRRFRWQARLHAKRMFDLFLTVPALLLLSPLLLVLGLLIRLDSPGPVLFLQTRVGRGGRHFRIFKFRTMTVDAEQHGLQITAGKDSRITRIGRWLRASKLDELPQLINVVRGEMSLVGPRPEVPHYVRQYPRHAREVVLSVPPGITDIASVCYRDESEVLGCADDPETVYLREILPRKLQLAQFYVSRHSILLDIGIMLATLITVASGKVPTWLPRGSHGSTNDRAAPVASLTGSARGAGDTSLLSQAA